MGRNVPRSNRVFCPLSLILAVALLLSSLSLSGCDATGGSIDRAMEIIDRAIRDIELNMDSWQAILQRVANELPDDISETVRVEADRLATRSIAKMGIEFRCNVDFLARRAIESLRRLKAMILDQNPPPLPPWFCQVDPAAIDLKVSPDLWSTAMLFGYDLDNADSSGTLLQVHLLTRSGQAIRMPESRIGRTTHYQLTLNLGNMARPLYQDQVDKIVVSWDGRTEGHPEIVIVPWEARRQTLTHSCGAVGPYSPPKTAGDADFDTADDAPTDLEVAGGLFFNEQTVQITHMMFAREREPDHTTVHGQDKWETCFTAPQGWRIVEVRPNLGSRVNAVVTVQGMIVLTRPAGEAVDHFEVWVDSDGDEAGGWTRIVTHWRRWKSPLRKSCPSGCAKLPRPSQPVGVRLRPYRYHSGWTMDAACGYAVAFAGMADRHG